MITKFVDVFPFFKQWTNFQSVPREGARLGARAAAHEGRARRPPARRRTARAEAGADADDAHPPAAAGPAEARQGGRHPRGQARGDRVGAVPEGGRDRAAEDAAQRSSGVFFKFSIFLGFCGIYVKRLLGLGEKIHISLKTPFKNIFYSFKQRNLWGVFIYGVIILLAYKTNYLNERY